MRGGLIRSLDCTLNLARNRSSRGTRGFVYMLLPSFRNKYLTSCPYTSTLASSRYTRKLSGHKLEPPAPRKASPEN